MNKKTIIIYFIIIILPILLLIVAFSLKPDSNYEIPEIIINERYNTLKTTIDRRVIENKFHVSGVVTESDNSLITTIIEKNEEIVLLKKVGEKFKKDEPIYKLATENILANYDGRITKIEDLDDSIIIYSVNNENQNIIIYLTEEEIEKLHLVEKIYIKEAYNCYIKEIDYKKENDKIKVIMQSDYKTWIGSNISVNFKIEEKNVLSIPIIFLSNDSVGTYVEIEDSNKQLIKKYIQTGISDGEYVEIISTGLSEGLQIFKKVNIFGE